MIVLILLMLLGLAMLVYGSDLLVDGSSSIARKLGVSEFVIGLTIVGFGTSCPELVVSVNGALAASSEVALGNVVGSNIMNILLILGLTSLLRPVFVSKQNKKIDIPMLIAVTLLFIVSCFNSKIGRINGAIFLVVFTAYIIYAFKTGKVENSQEEEKQIKTWLSVVMVLLGLSGLVFGGKLFVNNAVELAHRIGASEKFIAITILALGTSLPELVTCVVAAAKKKSQLALGNIIGSNIFNILLILGISSLIHPLDCSSLNYIDLCIMAASCLSVFVFSITSKKSQLSKLSGATMLLMEAGYLVYLFIQM